MCIQRKILRACVCESKNERGRHPCVCVSARLCVRVWLWERGRERARAKTRKEKEGIEPLHAAHGFPNRSCEIQLECLLGSDEESISKKGRVSHGGRKQLQNVELNPDFGENYFLFLFLLEMSSEDFQRGRIPSAHSPLPSLSEALLLIVLTNSDFVSISWLGCKK